MRVHGRRVHCRPQPLSTVLVADVSAAMAALAQLGFREAWTFDDTFACMYGDGDIELFLR